MRKYFFSNLMMVAALSLIGQSEFSNSTIQIGVVVEDLEKSLKFYTDIIGMTKTGGFSITDEAGSKLGLSAKIPFDVSVLKLVDEDNATEWKLMSFNKGSNHGPQKYIHNDTGMQYITIFVNSITPFVERLEANNVKFLGETPTKLPDGRNFILIQDPDGIFIELIGND